MESELASWFALSQAILGAEQGSEASQRQVIGRAAAEYLARRLRDGVTVAVGMGRNVNAVAEQLTAAPARRVCAIGGSPQVSAPVNPNDICHRLAEQFQSHAETLFAPAYVESAAVRESFLQHADVREAQLMLVGLRTQPL